MTESSTHAEYILHISSRVSPAKRSVVSNAQRSFSGQKKPSANRVPGQFSSRMEMILQEDTQSMKLEDKIFVFASDSVVWRTGRLLSGVWSSWRRKRSTSRRLFQRFRVGIPSPSNVARIIDPRPRNNYTLQHFFILRALDFRRQTPSISFINSKISDRKITGFVT